MMTGSTPLMIGLFVSGIPSADNVASESPELGTRCECGSPMDFLQLQRAGNVYVASNGNNSLYQGPITWGITEGGPNTSPSIDAA